MPNWCEVDVRFEGEQTKIDELLTFMGCNEEPAIFDIGRLIPYPDIFKQRDNEYRACADLKMKGQEGTFRDFVQKWGSVQDGYNAGGYDWCVANWGVKWRPSNVARVANTVSFQTPWAPPGENVWKMLQVRFPDVSFWVEYFERGMAFCGGFALCAEYWSSLDDWKPGQIESKWFCDNYRGKRGG